MENEINEFYNYQDNPYIQEGKKLFEFSFQKGNKTFKIYINMFILIIFLCYK